jgi:hypothetical protein
VCLIRSGAAGFQKKLQSQKKKTRTIHKLVRAPGVSAVRERGPAPAANSEARERRLNNTANPFIFSLENVF